LVCHDGESSFRLSFKSCYSVDRFFPWRIDRKEIGGYLGGGDQFDLAIGKFAVAYADQTEQDHAALEHAERTGRIVADAEAY
jgi:hypothetical protein